jgi:GTP cyclohydrolase I
LPVAIRADNSSTITTSAEIVSELLESLGEDPLRAGLVDTPNRVSRSLQFLTSGYTQEPKEILGRALFSAQDSEAVAVRDIEFYSLCEHHMLPFFGKVHIGYLPGAQVLGLSKLPRLVQVFSRRLQIQERLTGEIADTLMELLSPRGVIVVVEAQHLCMMMRGVQSQGASTLTQARRGDRSNELERLLAGSG